ncbi:MAG: DUF2723 domain-containing protein [bacterium]
MGKKDRKQKIDDRGQKRSKWKVQFRIPRFLIPKDELITLRAFTSIDYAGGIVVFFICWAVYLHTLTPTIGFHDSGDMVTAAFVLGIPHPTGYPLYCLLGKLWMTILPFGNIAYRMNLASALCASLACMMVYFIILKLTVNSRQWTVKKDFPDSPILPFSVSISKLIPAIVGALMLAFATTFWEQAVIAEKYMLNALFATLLIFILLKWQEAMAQANRGTKELKNRGTKEQIVQLPSYPITKLPNKLLYLFAFTLGLSFTHHMQTIYLVPASIFFIIAVYWKKWRQQKQSFYSLLSTLYPLLLKLLCLFILPLFLYLYLPIRASAHPVYNWGDPETFKRFMGHITGQSYKSYFTSEISEIYKNLSHIPHFLIDQFTQYFWWISLVGFFILLFKKRTISLFFLLMVIVNISFATKYSILNIEDYYILSYIIFSILLSICITFIINRILQRYKKGIIFSIFLFLIFPIISFLIHYQYNDRANYYFAYDYGRNILCPIDKNAVIFLKIDISKYPVSYLKYCENQRDDVALISTIFLPQDWFGIHKGIWYSKIVKEQYPDIDLTTPIQSHEVDSNNIIESVKRIKIKEIMSNKCISRSVFLMYDEKLVHDYILIPKGVFCKIMTKETKKEKIYEELKTSPRNFFIIRGVKKNDMIFKNARRTLGTIVTYLASYNIQGFIYKNLGMYEESINKYKSALEIKINDREIPYFIPYGNFYNGSLNEYKEYIGNVKTHLVEAYMKWGDHYEKKGLISKAVDLYKKADKIDFNNIELKNIIGYLYFKENRYQDAINEFKKAIEISPTNVKSHMNLATVYFEKGLFKEAMRECKCILKLEPNNIYAIQMLEEIKNKER